MSTREFYEREQERTIRKALRRKPVGRLSLGVDVKRCDGCVYKREFERLMALPNCNDCRYRARCEFSPHIGETARINCPTWAPEEKEDTET